MGRQASVPTDDPFATADALADDGSLFEGLVDLADEAEPNLETEWQYEQDGQVFGPISTKVLLERLYDGTLSPEARVALEGGDFRAIRRIGAFRAHLPKIAAHQAERAQARAAEAERLRRALLRRTAWLAGGLAVVGIGSVLLVGVIRYQRQAAAEATRQAKEAALQAELDDLLASVTIEPPLESLVAPNSGRSAPSSPRRRGRADRSMPEARATGALTRREVLRGVSRAFGGLKHCIVEQIQREPDSVGPQIVLTFSIANDGRARNITLQNRFLRRTPMLPCFQRAMQRVRWRAFRGEVRNVEYPISVRR